MSLDDHPPTELVLLARVERELTADDICWDMVTAPADEADVTDATELLTNALIEAQSYRVLAQEAINSLAALTTRYSRLREAHRRLLQASRELRRGTR